MAIGDQQDCFNRLKATLPRWFGDDTPILDALLNGLAWAASFAYALYAYARLQTRIKTATDGWLDMIAADFFGGGLLRRANQGDISYRARIIAALFRERATRNAIKLVLEDLTGRTPRIFEPMRPMDTGGYGLAYGYNSAGGYGSMLIGPFQGFVDAFRPVGAGIPNVAGYGLANYGATNGGPGGYGTASQIEYASLASVQDSVTDADIYDAVESVRPAGSVIWVRINN